MELKLNFNLIPAKPRGLGGNMYSKQSLMECMHDVKMGEWTKFRRGISLV